MSADAAQMTGSGQEILVADADDKVLKGLARLLGDAGLVVTGTTDPARARDQLVHKYFAVALVDIDTPTPGGGVELVRFAREKSPLTTIIMMSPRKAFEVALEAFRAGAADLVIKQPDSVAYLRDRVVSAAREIRTSSERGRLLEEVAQVHEDFLKRMMDLSKQLVDLEDRVLGRGGAAGAEESYDVLSVLVVDDDPTLHASLRKALPEQQGWRIRLAQTGGEALDAATQGPCQVVVVKETLPDLPGTMVHKTLKASVPDAVALLFTPSSGPGRPGEIRMADGSRLMTLVPEFYEPGQLVASLGEVREAIRQKFKERRYLQAFRQQQFEFLKRYNEIKQRVNRALERKDPMGSVSGARRF